MPNNYMDLLPQDIQDKIMDIVYNTHYQQEHQAKYGKFLNQAVDQALLRDYNRTIEHILSIEDINELVMELNIYYQWLADNKMIYCITSYKSHEVYLLNPFKKGYKSLCTVSSCWRKDFHRRGLDWFAEPIYETNINSDSLDEDKMDIDLWVELAPNKEIQIIIVMDSQFID